MIKLSAKLLVFSIVISSSAYAGPSGYWFTDGARSDNILHAPGTTLDNKTILQWAQNIDLANKTANLAIPKIGNLDSNGNIITPINTNIIHIKGDTSSGLRIADPLHTGEETKFYYDANTYEFTIENGASENNSLAFKNTNSCGLAANTYVGYDQQYKRISEHGAIGWGPCLPYYNTTGYDYLEISRYPYAIDGYPDDIGKEAPPAFLLQKTGIEIIPYGSNEDYGTVSKGSSSITCVNCTWAQGIKAGQTIDIPNQPGIFPNGTTVVSGAGTSTLVVSNAALNDLIDPIGGTWVRIGDTEYSQHDWFEDSATGCLNFWTWGGAKFGAFYGKPFVCFERNDGKVGFGGEENPTLPVDALGGVGGNVSGKHPDRTFYGSQNAAINAQVSPGNDNTTNTILNAYGYNLDRLTVRWLTNPSRIEYQDANNNNMPLWTLYVGSPSGGTVGQSKQTAHPVETITGDYTASVPSDCGTTLNVNTTVTTTLTIPTYMPQGCTIGIVQTGTGSVNVTPASGLSIHYNSGGTPQNGVYTMNNQYSGIHLEYLDQTNVIITSGL